MRKLTLSIIIFQITIFSQMAFAFNIDGEYDYQENGCSGSLKIEETTLGDDSRIIARIDTICSEQSHTCSFIAEGYRFRSKGTSFSVSFRSDDHSFTYTYDDYFLFEYDDLARFHIDFTLNSAFVDISFPGYYCGMKGRYDGRYIKQSSRQQVYSKAEAILGYMIEECKTAYEEENRTDAIEKCTEPAEAGHAIAQLNLGLSYIKEKEYDVGFNWLTKSSSNGRADAEFILGLCFLYGWGTEKNISKAIEVFTKIITMGDRYSISDVEKLTLLRAIPLAQYTLASLYETGDGVTKDYTSAVKWYRMAAGNSNIDALNAIRRLAEHGIAVAQFNLAEMYLSGFGVKMNIPLALEWARRGSENGSQDAKDLYMSLSLEELLFAADIRNIEELADAIKNKCTELQCVFDLVWRYIDKSGDGNLSLAEIARFQRNIVKFVYVKEDDADISTGKMFTVNLASILILPMAASSVINSFDYDNDGVLSVDEVVGDTDFASLVGIDLKHVQKGTDFEKVGKGATKLLESIPLLK